MSETEERIAEIKARAEAIERLGAGRDNAEQAYADDIPWLLAEHARLTAELREAKRETEAARTERNRIGLEVRRELLATAETQRKRAEAAEAEVERLRTLVDAIVTSDGEARGIGEGLRQAAVFVKGWCRCSEAFVSRGLRDPGCQACDLADELEGQADEILLSAVEKQARDRGALERAIAHHEAEAEREAITSPVRAGLHRQLVELYRKSLAALEAPDGS